MAPKKNYIAYPLYLTLIVIGALIAIGFIPPFSIGSVNFKQINILSQITDPLKEATQSEADTQMDTLTDNVVITLPDSLSTDSTTTQEIDDKIVRFEDFSLDQNGMSRIYQALENSARSRPVRIAMIGDSFIEGDILCADIREQLQTEFGGSGVGFVPFATPMAANRPTVKQTYSGWNIFNIMKKSAQKNIKDSYFISGITCTPNQGAYTKLEGVAFRKKLLKCSSAKLLFVNQLNATIDVTINDSVKMQYTPESSSEIQKIRIDHEIQKIEVQISNPEGFVGYGIVLEDNHGVSVDNFSIRGNSGYAIRETSVEVNRRIGELVGYDLVIVEYGLNVLTSENHNYSAFASQLTAIIEVVKQSFPQSSIVVMGVSDRSTMRDGVPVSMTSIKPMIEAQKLAAQATNVMFWDTFRAMGGKNSMATFVERNWAAKDYTHIGYPGGRFIATQFVAAFRDGRDGFQKKQRADQYPSIAKPSTDE